MNLSIYCLETNNNKQSNKQFSLTALTLGVDELAEYKIFRRKFNSSIISNTLLKTSLFFSLMGLFMVLSLVLFSSNASAACINLTGGMQINSSTSLCSGSHNITATVNITADNIVFDCSSATITTTGAPESAISVVGRNNISINNCIVRNHNTGLNTFNSNITLQNGQFSQNNIGILSNNSNMRVLSSTLTANNISLLIDQNTNGYFYLNTINNNNNTAVLVIGGRNNSLANNFISANNIGVRLFYTENNSLSANTINSNNIGLLIENGSRNSVTNNVFNANSLYGIFVNSSINNTIVSNFLYINNISDSSTNLTINTYCKNSVENKYYLNATGPRCIDIIPLSVSILNLTNNTIFTANAVAVRAVSNKNAVCSYATDKCQFENNATSCFSVTGWTAMELTGGRNHSQNLTLSNNIFNETYSVYMNCTAGNKSAFNAVKFKIDSSPVGITIMSPQNMTYNNSKVFVQLNLSKQVKYIKVAYDNSATYQIVCNFNCTQYKRNQTFAQGVHKIKIQVVDYAGRIYNSTAEFNVDSMPPQIVRTLPLPNSLNNGYPNFTVVYNERNLRKVVLSIINTNNSNEVKYELNCTSGFQKKCSTKINLSAYHGLTLQYYFNISDVNASAYSQKYYFTVDSQGPQINIFEPAENSTKTGMFYINATLEEKAKRLNATLDSGNAFPLCYNCIKVRRSFNIPKGNHTLTLTAEDLAGNTVARIIRFYYG